MNSNEGRIDDGPGSSECIGSFKPHGIVVLHDASPAIMTANRLCRNLKQSAATDAPFQLERWLLGTLESFEVRRHIHEPMVDAGTIIVAVDGNLAFGKRICRWLSQLPQRKRRPKKALVLLAHGAAGCNVAELEVFQRLATLARLRRWDLFARDCGSATHRGLLRQLR